MPRDGSGSGVEKMESAVVHKHGRKTSWKVEMKVKLMGYNIRHGLGCDGHLDLERIARVIEREAPDLVGLNEVDVRFHHRSGFADQLGWLAARLGMDSLFGPAIRHTEATGEPAGYGNGLLIKGQVHNVRNRRVQRRGEEPRALLIAEWIPPGETVSIRVVVTHMGLSPWMRRQQVDLLLEECRDLSQPVVALGDWNVTPGRSAVVRLAPFLLDTLGESGVSDSTYPCPSPRKRIDYIFCSRHFYREKASVVVTPECPSDHLPVLSVLKLKSEKEPEFASPDSL